MTESSMRSSEFRLMVPLSPAATARAQMLSSAWSALAHPRRLSAMNGRPAVCRLQDAPADECVYVLGMAICYLAPVLHERRLAPLDDRGSIDCEAFGLCASRSGCEQLSRIFRELLGECVVDA